MAKQQEQVEVLRRVPLFSDLTKRELQQVARTVNDVTHPAGHVIVTEGDKGVGLHIIISGQAKVSRNGRTVARLGPGDYFGEMSMIDGGPRTATVTADTPLRLLGLTFWDFHPLLKTSPSISYKLLVKLCARLREAEGEAPERSIDVGEPPADRYPLTVAMLRVAAAQLDLVVGDLVGNEACLAEAMDWAEGARADVLLLPELAVTGYPPEDLVLRPGFVDANLEVVRRLASRSGDVVTIVGFVDRAAGPGRHAADAVPRTVANAAAVLCAGAIRGVYHKVLLPNYGVFDEDRYFAIGSEPARTWDLGGVVVGVSICEDMWLPDGPPQQQAEAGAQVLLNINASPFHYGKAEEREAMLRQRSAAARVPVVYLNLVGGQDELVFDGASVVIAPDGVVLARAAQFAQDRLLLDLPLPERRPEAAPVPVRTLAVSSDRSPYQRRRRAACWIRTRPRFMPPW